jgi:predicted dehydrogenase
MGPPETTKWEWPFPDKSWAVEIEEFVASIEQKRRPIGDIHDAVHTMSVIEQVYAGARP